jgi:hypothetical protein
MGSKRVRIKRRKQTMPKAIDIISELYSSACRDGGIDSRCAYIVLLPKDIRELASIYNKPLSDDEVNDVLELVQDNSDHEYNMYLETAKEAINEVIGRRK